MPGLATKEDLSEAQKSTLELVTKRFRASERQHKDLDPRWNSYYGLSRNYKRLRKRHAQAQNERDRDSVMQEFRRVFGEDLFVPWIYTAIETVLPAILANGPTITAKPTAPGSENEEACEPVANLLESTQREMSYDRRLQETVRSGLRYGLGVQKTFWECKTRSGKKIQQNQSGPGYQVVNDDHICVYEGPKAESVDIFDFFWDPIAYDLQSAGYVIHRTWRSMEYITDRVAEGKARRAKNETGGWAELDLERVKGLASTTARGEVWAERMQAAGMSHYEGVDGNELFEVWEYHDRDNVYTVLGRELLVQEAENPFLHGDFPFQIFRPTIVEHELVGIGEAEPIAHLQYELNAMRGQRRDAATLALSPPFFYTRGMLNPKQLVWGAGVFNPIDGNPDEVIKQANIRDLPSSSVEEENALKQDIQLASGLSEAFIGSSGGETATETQLLQTAANRRIKQMTKNLHVDLLVPAAKQMYELLRQHVTDEKQPKNVRLEKTGVGKPSYSFQEVGPAELNAKIEVAPVDGSTESENETQKRADAVQEVDALSPFMEEIDKRALAKSTLRKLGHAEPEELLLPPGPSTEEAVKGIGEAMQQAGIPPEEIQKILEAAHGQVLSPSNDPPEPESSGSSNGSAPQPVGG
jgi:hypothetical protein